MKKIAAIMMLAILAGCTTKTENGACIGAFDNKQSGLEYKLSVWNTFLAVVFVETIVVPIVVVANEAVCPVAKIEQPKKVQP